MTEFSSPSFLCAEVAVPLRVSHTYTYRLPPDIQQCVTVGARLVVPFGSKLIVGYVVALHENCQSEAAEIKEADELLDAEARITPEILELTRWISQYYAAPWGEVLKGALPAGLNATFEEIFTATSSGVAILEKTRSQQKRKAALRALEFITAKGSASLSAISRHLNRKNARVLMRELLKRGYVTAGSHRREANPGSRMVKKVRLISNTGPELNRLTVQQMRVLEVISSSGGEMLYPELLRLAQASSSTVTRLARNGLLEIFEVPLRRDPLALTKLTEIIPFQLTEEQELALNQIQEALTRNEFRPFLLHGVTGSGKTEVYIRAMDAALRMGKSAVMLVPEIALTPVFSARLRSRFGEAVAMFHSSLKPGERFDEWNRLRTGEARLVIGTRSAIFAPVSNLGIVIVDEEHDSSYCQQESPYYNARDAAVMRALSQKAVVVLGSATPSLESFHNARTGKYSYLCLARRIGNRPMAQAEIIDMREVLKSSGKLQVFSDKLLKAIEDTGARGEQSIILLNRRGYSSFLLCRSCGERINCDHCDVTLTFHRSQKSLICHYCNFRRKVPESCPSCAGQFIYYIGQGTEQIEEILRQRFPTFRIARLDRDTSSKRSAREDTIARFSTGEIDILIGTQMIAKGHDFPNVTLVGVVSVDAGLGLPDFRAAERTFQLITQVAGRAGRGDRAGSVLIQTYYPRHYALRHACDQNYEGFYQEEIKYRKGLRYPPFVVLGSIMAHGSDLARTHELATKLKQALDRANQHRSCRVLGPAPAPIARLRGEHRVQILIKGSNRRRLREVLDMGLAELSDENPGSLRSLNVEIDPANMM